MTGERLDEESDLFEVDRLRHLAAYAFAKPFAAGGRVLDFGCGSGYGAAELVPLAAAVTGMDRFIPEPDAQRAGLRYVRADLERAPVAPAAFDLVVSFQVIEHLVDPSRYLAAIARALRDDGVALISTPNLLQSDGENPFHVHEYEAEELSVRLREHFDAVEMLGVHTGPAVGRYYAERLERIRRITRLDPLGIRRRLPASILDLLFTTFARVVRRGIQNGSGFPEAGLDDFPVGPVSPDCIDLLAVCRRPHRR